MEVGVEVVVVVMVVAVIGHRWQMLTMLPMLNDHCSRVHLLQVLWIAFTIYCHAQRDLPVTMAAAT